MPREMGKGAQTRDQILERAAAIASRDGLEGLSIGSLAGDLGMSKSGLFAHFGSKEELQLQVLRAAAARFANVVLMPALAAPRGEPRLRALFENWFAWEQESAAGGCIMIAASVELDDQPGPLRDYLVEVQQQWLGALARAARLAVEEGHFRADLDDDQFAFEMKSLMLGFHDLKRLLRDPSAEARVRTAFERLILSARA